MYFLPLNLKKIDVVRPDWVRPMDMVKWKGADYAKEVFTDSFLEKLSSIAKVSGLMIFNKMRQHNPVTAHIDVALINNKPIYINYGLNVVFDDSTDMSSKMQWYTRKNPEIQKHVLISPGNTPYINFSTSELTLESEYSIDEYITLVRTDIPHSICSGNGIRTCVSLRFHENHDWEKAVELFNKTFNQ